MILAVSLPSRERGLKYDNAIRPVWDWIVAPFTGAWIEIHADITPRSREESLPSRERGLKYEPGHRTVVRRRVAPFTGAWIEILIKELIWCDAPGRSLHGSVD